MVWLKAILFSSILYALVLTYGYFYAGTLSFAQISEALAGTGGILIGSSFALSGMSYFFNFLDRDLQYRKQLGICGYFFALSYAITLLIRFPEKYDLLHPSFLLEVEAAFGFIALGILTTMALISENFALKLLGPKLWRRILHSGYFAYLLLIVRAILVEGTLWAQWWITRNTLPPPRLLLTIFACGVLLLRFCMEISLRVHKQNQPKQNTILQAATESPVFSTSPFSTTQPEPPVFQQPLNPPPLQ